MFATGTGATVAEFEEDDELDELEEDEDDEWVVDEDGVGLMTTGMAEAMERAVHCPLM